MPRTPQIVSPQRPRKPASFSIVRAFPERGAAAASELENPGATPRVRDGLVLRQVGKKKTAAKVKTAARAKTDARRAR